MARFGAYAYFPGTGPDGRYCRQCASLFAVDKGSKRHCRRYYEFKDYARPGSEKPINPNTAACKYFTNATEGIPS